MPNLTGGLSVSCPSFPWRLPMLGMLLLVPDGLRSYLPLLFQLDSILLSFRLIYGSQLP